MDTSFLISIIVTVYNVKEYLDKCIKSILSQTYENIEIVLINDGSTDGSDKICDTYMNIDKRVKVYHEKNEGVAEARKKGILYATGKYIGFVDGDDWIEKDTYEKMLQKAIMYNAQIVMCDMYRHKFTGEVTIWSGASLSEGAYSIQKDGEKIAQHLISGLRANNNGINGGVHIKLFEREILLEQLKYLDKRILFAEDKILLYPSIFKSQNIYVYHKAFYHGVDRDTSLTHSKHDNALEVLQLVFNALKEEFEKTAYKKILLKQLYEYVMLSCISNINQWTSKPLVPEYYIQEKRIKGKNIVLYGAGKVGQSVYKQIKLYDLCNIVMWVDKKPQMKENVFSPDMIYNIDFDYILIAVKDQQLAESIECKLVEKGILKEKIIIPQYYNLIELFYSD